jgi:hypothetical protein
VKNFAGLKMIMFLKQNEGDEVEGGELTREKGIRPDVMEGSAGGTQGHFLSPFLKGNQIGSPKKGDIRNFTLIGS